MTLAITRRPGEQIEIGDNVVITVVFVKGGKVRLAIDAPAHVRIRRPDAKSPPRGDRRY